MWEFGEFPLLEPAGDGFKQRQIWKEWDTGEDLLENLESPGNLENSENPVEPCFIEAVDFNEVCW